jgi:hypothetical protein
MGRPRLPGAEKLRRGTLQPSRAEGASAHHDITQARPRWGSQCPEGYVAIADRYVRDIVTGRIVACQWVVKAVERFEPMRRRAADRTCPFRFSTDEANAVCAFVEQLPHVEGRWGTDAPVLAVRGVSRLVQERLVQSESEHRATAPPQIAQFYRCADCEYFGRAA